MRILTVFGFAFCLVGFFTGAVLSEKTIGATIFIIGFLLTAIGMVGRTVLMKPENDAASLSTGIKISSIGFLVFALALASDFIWSSGTNTNFVQYVGLSICLAGIFWSMLSMKVQDK